MFGFFKKKIDLSDLSNLTMHDIEKLKKSKGGEYSEILTKAADQGSLDCQKVLSSFYLASMVGYYSRPPHTCPTDVEEKFLKYAEMAAYRGDITSQCNLGKYYYDKIDLSENILYDEDHEYVKKTEFWYKKAADQGCEDSINIIEKLDFLFRLVD